MLQLTRVFGVEIELNCHLKKAYYGDLRRIHMNVSDFDLTPDNQRRIRQGGPHPMGEFTLLPGWKYVYDGTCGSEIVSPPLCSTWSVREMCKRINLSGISFNLHNTGLHVHCQAVDFNGRDIMNVARFCRHFDRTIFSFMSPERIKHEYCRPIAKNDKKIQEGVDMLMMGKGGGIDRYIGCNIQSYAKHGTIEFRYAQGTTCPDRIDALVDLYTSIMDWVKSSYKRIESPKGRDAKRNFLLDLINVEQPTKDKLLGG